MQTAMTENLLETLAGIFDYYGREPTREALVLQAQAYESEGVDADQVRQAFFEHLKGARSAFLPQPGELLAIIRGSGDEQAERAWRSVQTMLRHASPYRPVAWENPITQQTVAELGGWGRLARIQDNRELERYRQQFLRTYGEIQRAGGTDAEMPPALPGLSDVEAVPQRFSAPESAGNVIRLEDRRRERG